MGFGLICAGYTTLFFLRTIPAELIGFFVIARGLRKLSGYNVFFKAALYVAYALLAFSAVDAVVWTLGMAGVIAKESIVNNVMSYVHILLLLPFHLFLFRALRTISESLGYTRGARRATFAMSLVSVYYVVYVLSLMKFPLFGQYLMLTEFLLYIVCIFVTLSAVYTCYRAITTDEAEKKEEEKLEKYEKRFGKKGKKK